MLPMHGLNLISIQINLKIVVSGLHAITIQPPAIPRVVQRTQMYLMIMIFGSILPLQKWMDTVEVSTLISGIRIQVSKLLG